MQQRVYQTKVQNVNDLRQRLIDVWNGMEQCVVVSMHVFRPKEDTLSIHCDLLICLMFTVKKFFDNINR